jgi:hypothetical protein
MVLGLDACEYPTAFLVRWVMFMFHHQTMHVEQGALLSPAAHGVCVQ